MATDINPGLDKQRSASTSSNDGEPIEDHESSQNQPLDLEKQETRQQEDNDLTTSLSRTTSVISKVRSRKPGQDRPFTHKLARQPTTKDVLVDFEGPDDPYHPLNWTTKKKTITTALYGLTTAGTGLASAIISPGVNQIAHRFNVGPEVATLSIALFLFGLGLGPMVWGPLSEAYGRKPAVLAPFFVAAMFLFGTGASENIQTLCICRFFAGFFGSAPVTNTGGVLGDVWTPKYRGMAMVGYAYAVAAAPLIGPVIGGSIVQSHLGWRWTEYITGIYMMFILTLDMIFIDESCPPILLMYKARRLRIRSGNWALHAPHEEWDISFRDLANKYLIRPIKLLGTPICAAVALYASFVYGLLYSTLTAFPVEFQEIRGWGQVVGTLPFLAQFFGVILGGIANILNQQYYFKRLQANNGRPVPEARLPPMMIGGVIFSGGLFIFAWTSDPHIFWFPSIVGCAMIGMGFTMIFQAALNYLVDTFTANAASAIAANTFLRSCFAGSFPLFITPELHAIGVPWGISIFGFVSVLLIPIPFVFFVYGKRIRARGAWSKASV